jgi:hypothetical protein
MESFSRPEWWRFDTTGALFVLVKLLVLCVAWLIFFYLIIVGWDLHVQQEQVPQKKPPYERLLG